MKNPKMSRFPMDVPFPPPHMVRLLDLESAWKCSRSDGLEMRIPKVTLKSQIGHLEPVLGNVEKSKIWTIFTQPNGVVGGTVVIEQLPRTALKLNFPGLYMDRVF